MSNNLIGFIRIDGLFGLYSYMLPNIGALSDASILYGDNGVGKSTVLRLVFHLISPGNNKGHRTALYETEFEYLEVTLSSGIQISAKKIKKDDLSEIFLKIEDRGKIIVTWNYFKGRELLNEPWNEFVFLRSDEGQIVRRKRRDKKLNSEVPEGEEAFLNALKMHVPAVFILNAERRLDSDEVADPSDEMELRGALRKGEPRRINDIVARSREIGLSQALDKAHKWINIKSIRSSNEGSLNVNQVYKNIVSQIKRDKNSDASNVDPSNLIERLLDIEKKTRQFSLLEMQNAVSVDEFVSSLGNSMPVEASLTSRLLNPYVESLEARIKALEPIYNIVNRFITIINSLINDKEIRYSLVTGFSIYNSKNSKLEIRHLSSGEQQLLLLFSYVIIARDKPSIFMIDEPEISLNIKWQRKLVTYLLEMADGASTQFLLATHSLELLAQHRNKVVKLENNFSS